MDIDHKITDMDVAYFLIEHAQNPCIDLITGQDIKEFYIREAKKAIETLENPLAIEALEKYVKAYSGEQAEIDMHVFTDAT